MNNDRRKRLNSAVSTLQGISEAFTNAKETVQEILDEENETYENMPENLQSSERGERSQEAISNLENAIGSFDSFDIDDVISTIEAATE